MFREGIRELQRTLHRHGLPATGRIDAGLLTPRQQSRITAFSGVLVGAVSVGGVFVGTRCFLVAPGLEQDFGQQEAMFRCGLVVRECHQPFVIPARRFVIVRRVAAFQSHGVVMTGQLIQGLTQIGPVIGLGGRVPVGPVAAADAEAFGVFALGFQHPGRELAGRVGVGHPRLHAGRRVAVQMGDDESFECGGRVLVPLLLQIQRSQALVDQPVVGGRPGPGGEIGLQGLGAIQIGETDRYGTQGVVGQLPVRPIHGGHLGRGGPVLKMLIEHCEEIVETLLVHPLFELGPAVFVIGLLGERPVAQGDDLCIGLLRAVPVLAREQGLAATELRFGQKGTVTAVCDQFVQGRQSGLGITAQFEGP